MFQLKGKTKKLFNLVLSMLMILSLLPGGVLKPTKAWADELPENEAQEVSYRYPVYNTAGDPTSGIKEWNTETISDYIEIKTGSDKAVTWGKEGNTTWYVVSGGTAGKPIEIAGVKVKGNVHLILKDGCSLKVSVDTTEPAGICVSNSDPTKPDNTLTIYGQSSGTGALNAIGGLAGAGIGGGTGESGSNITINGGKVTADGVVGGAGIGGGLNGNGSNITINGGNVTATGKHQGAGIGGGSYRSGSNITINGGYVTANGREGGAGIGGGCQGGNGSNITINGGTVVANGETEKDYTGAGIGGGFQGSGSKITINGGLVTATGGKESAGIGSGSSGSGSDIYAADSVEVRADIAANPRNVIDHESSTTDIAEYLKNNQYATTGIPNYLTFTAEEEGAKITFKANSAVRLEYQMKLKTEDWSNDWIDVTSTKNTNEQTLQNKGDQIRFRGNNVTTDSNKNFKMTGKIKASGDVTSLTNAYGGDAVPDANGYKRMFSGCESLITAPALPITMLAKGCCYSMFNGCSKLLVAEKGTHEPYTGDEFFTCPSTLPTDAVTEMFSGTGGDFTGTPTVGKTYYSYTTKVTLNQKDPTKAGTVTKVYASKDMALPALSGAQLPVKDNYVFNGYFDAETGGNKYYNADGSSVANWDKAVTDVTLYARWAVDISKAAVGAIADSTYSGSAQTPDPEVKYGGSKLTKDTDYTLSYSDNKDAGTATLTVTGIGDYIGTKDVSFTITRRSVTFTSATDSKTYDGTPLTNNNVAVTGDGFAGEEGAAYNVTGTRTEVGSSPNIFTYTMKDGTKEGNYDVTTVEGTLTVAEVVFDVEFDLNGKGTDTPQTQHVASGSCATKPADPTYSGWSFKYWFKQGTTAAFDFAAKIIENIKLIAFWEENPAPAKEYTVSFNANGGSGSMNDMETKDQKLTLPANGFTAPEGKEFDGWGVGSKTAETKAAGTVVTFSANTTVYAKWKDKSPIPPEPSPSGGSGSSSSSEAKPVKLGTWGDPVTGGTWSIGSDGKWMYRTNAYFKNTWGFIRNPYAKEGQEKDSWFRFDAEGKMLTGWQFIDNNWYYLNPVSDGTQGRCYFDTTTPDGYKVDKNGAWVK